MKKTLVLLFALIVAATSVTGAKKKKVKVTPAPSTIEIITKVNDYWQQNHKPQVRAFWDEAAYQPMKNLPKRSKTWLARKMLPTMRAISWKTSDGYCSKE